MKSKKFTDPSSVLVDPLADAVRNVFEGPLEQVHPQRAKLESHAPDENIRTEIEERDQVV